MLKKLLLGTAIVMSMFTASEAKTLSDNIIRGSVPTLTVARRDLNDYFPANTSYTVTSTRIGYIPDTNTYLICGTITREDGAELGFATIKQGTLMYIPDELINASKLSADNKASLKEASAMAVQVCRTGMEKDIFDDRDFSEVMDY